MLSCDANEVSSFCVVGLPVVDLIASLLSVCFVETSVSGVKVFAELVSDVTLSGFFLGVSGETGLSISMVVGTEEGIFEFLSNLSAMPNCHKILRML